VALSIKATGTPFDIEPDHEYEKNGLIQLDPRFKRGPYPRPPSNLVDPTPVVPEDHEWSTPTENPYTTYPKPDKDNGAKPLPILTLIGMPLPLIIILNVFGFLFIRARKRERMLEKKGV
jgi:hypothetical protein